MGRLLEKIATICEQQRSYDLEHESPITTWDIGAQFFVIVPCRDEAQRGVHGLETNLGEIVTMTARKRFGSLNCRNGLICAPPTPHDIVDAPPCIIFEPPIPVQLFRF